MKRPVIYLAVFILILFLFGCDGKTETEVTTTMITVATTTTTTTSALGTSQTTAPPPPSVETTSDYRQEERELRSFLPVKTGYTWKYEGTAGYGHKMSLDEISANGRGIRYVLNGNVDDMSDGESGRDLDLSFVYEIIGGELVQHTNTVAQMDSVYKKITLLKAPVYDGMIWTQEALTKEDTVVTLECSVKEIFIDQVSGYEVTYRQAEGNYYESRQFFPGKGITSFKRLFVAGGDEFEIGFDINEMMSGHLDEIRIKSILPPFGMQLWYYGIAEYAHTAAWTDTKMTDDGMMFVFSGEFADGSGIPGEFTVEYILDRNNGTVIESVKENTRSGDKHINSLLHDFIILKTPLTAGNNWTQNVMIDSNEYELYSVIISVYIDSDDYSLISYRVRYTIEGMPGYFNDTFIQERVFKTGAGMVSFSQLMEGDIGLSGKELEDDHLVEQAIINHMFGYGSSFNN